MRIMEEEQKEKLTGRGGAGRGQGRKPKDKVAAQHITLKLRKDFLEIIHENFMNRSEFIQDAVKEKLRREGLI